MEYINIKVPRPSNVCEALWKEVAKKVKNAVVFIDEYIVESLHWSHGLDKLLDGGAKDIKEFATFEHCDEKAEKAVFLIGTAIFGTVADILKDIIKSSKFKYVIVVTGAHPSVHTYAMYGGREEEEKYVMGRLEENILNWMGNMNYTAEVFYYPVLLVPATEDTFLFPRFSDMYPLLDSDLTDINKLYLEFAKGDKKVPASLNDLEFHHLPFKFRIVMRQFIVCMHSYLQGMNAREEIYSLGHLSRIVATELDTYNPARQRRKISPNKVSLVFIDRTIDLVAPCSNSNDTLMNRILSLLPRLPGQMIDSAVNMSPLCSVHPSCEWTLIPGNFAHNADEATRSILLSSFNASMKETVSLINKKISSKIERSKSVEDNLLSNIKELALTKDSLEHNFGLIQQGLAAVEIENHPLNSHLDQLHSMEKMFVQSINDSEEMPPIKQIIQLLNTRRSRNVSIEEILCLLMFAVSLGGSEMFDGSLRYSLVNGLSQALLEDRMKLTDSVREIVGRDIDEVSALKTATSIWNKLESVAKTRINLKDYNELFQRKSDAEPYVYKNLLTQVVRDCLLPPQQPLTDLEYRSAGFKDIIKTGFSLFVNVSKPKPRDAAMIIIYIIGGITPSEIKALHDLVNEVKPQCEVLIGSSHLTFPSDAVARCLADNRLIRSY